MLLCMLVMQEFETIALARMEWILLLACGNSSIWTCIMSFCNVNKIYGKTAVGDECPAKLL